MYELQVDSIKYKLSATLFNMMSPCDCSGACTCMSDVRLVYMSDTKPLLQHTYMCMTYHALASIILYIPHSGKIF